MTQPSSFARRLSWLTGGYLARSATLLALTAVLARALGPDGYGGLTIFLSAAAGIAYLGASWAFLAVPILGNDRERLGPATGAAARVAVGGALLVTPFALLYAGDRLDGGVGELALLVAYAAALVALQGAYAVFQTEGQMRTIAFAQASERLVALVLVGTLIAIGGASIRKGELSLAGGAALVAVVAVRLALPRVRRSGGEVRGAHVSPRLVLRTVGLMSLITVCSYAVAWIDIWILAALRPAHDVGVYGLAYQVFSFCLQLGSLWIVVALPDLSRQTAAGETTVEALLPRALLLRATRIWSAAVGLLAVVAAAGLSTVFGDDFRAARSPLLILLAGAGLLLPYFATVPLLLSLRRTKLLAVVSVCGVLINIALDVALIPAIGALGPAIATAVQGAVVTVWLVAAMIPRTDWRPLAFAAAPVAVTIAILLSRITGRVPIAFACLVVIAAVAFVRDQRTVVAAT